MNKYHCCRSKSYSFKSNVSLLHAREQNNASNFIYNSMWVLRKRTKENMYFTLSFLKVVQKVSLSTFMPV